MLTKNRITISDIKYDTLASEPYFFDRKTMKFFGQTMRDFHVRKSPEGRIFIVAKRKHGGLTVRQYVPGTVHGHGELHNVNIPQGMHIEDYIAQN